MWCGSAVQAFFFVVLSFLFFFSTVLRHPQNMLLVTAAFALAAAALGNSQEIISHPVSLKLPEIPSAPQTDSQFEFAFASGQVNSASQLCASLKSPESRATFGCEKKQTAAEVKTVWKQRSAWEALACMDENALGQKVAKSTAKTIVDDVLGSTAVVDGRKLSLNGKAEDTGRFLFACSQVPTCLKDMLTREEREGFALFLLDQKDMTPAVALGLKALEDFGMTSVLIKHEDGNPKASVQASTLLGKPAKWTLGDKTSKLVSAKSSKELEIQQQTDKPSIEVEIQVGKASKTFTLAFPVSVELSELQVVIKDKGVKIAELETGGNNVLQVDKNQALEVSFQLGGLCPDHAVLVLVGKTNKKEAYFPLTCNGEHASPKLSLANTVKLSEQLDFDTVCDLQLIVSDDAIQNGIQKRLGQVHLAAHARPEKKHLPLFATSLLHESDTTRVALPEIHHKFREPDRRAPKLFALVFAAAQVAWLVGLNLTFAAKSNFHALKVFSSARLLFFASVLTTIEIVFVWYWIGEAGAPNMENLTYKYLPPLLALLAIASKAAMTSSHYVKTEGGESKKKVASM